LPRPVISRRSGIALFRPRAWSRCDLPAPLPPSLRPRLRGASLAAAWRCRGTGRGAMSWLRKRASEALFGSTGGAGSGSTDAGSGSTGTGGDAAVESEPDRRRQRLLVRRRTPIGDRPQPDLSAKDLADGHIVETVAKRCVWTGIELFGRPSVRGVLKVGSLCSGSEMVSAVCHAFTAVAAEQKLDFSFQTAFACEFDSMKRHSCTGNRR